MKELSAERRALVAAALSLLVIIGWSFFYKPPKPPANAPQSQNAAAQPSGAPTAPAEQAPPVSFAAAPPVAAGTKAATEEKIIVVENDLYRVALSNRGAVVKSWQLKKYKDDHKPPRTLDLVHPEAAEQTGSWPLALVLDDPQLQARANAALFDATSPGTSLNPPAEIQFEWSDGHLAVSKRLKFNPSYVTEIEVSATLDGKPLAVALGWLGGFGDATVDFAADKVQVFFSAGGKLQMLPNKKLGEPNQASQRLRQEGAFDYTGIQDQYFVAAFLAGANPAQPGAPGSTRLALWHWKLERDVQQGGKPSKEPVAQVAAGSTTPGPLDVRLFVGAKDLDDLKRTTPPLSDLVQFGWLEFIAAPLFYMLRWLHRYISNYGWAIVMMTLLINMVLFPLKVKGWRIMQKQQKLQPEIKAIQDRYKKYSMRDPRKAEMNKEVMALYQREGISPFGGCLPTLVQFPIWFGLYRMLTVTIELRHAPWLGWIHDLAAKDPYYILPVIMGITMYIMTKMTPTTVTDPAQQTMMKMMPLAFAAMFVILPVSSGLVLYILTSNLIGIAQQWYLNRTAPAEAKAPVKGKKK